MTRTGPPPADRVSPALPDVELGLAAQDPVARVALLLDPPHLDRPFDYLVPAGMAQRAVAGMRVRVRFSGRLVDGFLLERRAASDHVGELRPLHAVVGGLAVLTPAVTALVRAVAGRYAGTFADVVRAAVPPRHGQAETRVLAVAEAAGGQVLSVGSRDPGAGTTVVAPGGVPDPGPGPAPGTAAGSAGPPSADAAVDDEELVPAGWMPYAGAAGFLGALRRGAAPRAAWVAGPGERACERVAELVASVVQSGRGAIVVVPDARAVSEFAAALRTAGVPFETLVAAVGPQARYSAFLRVLTGARTVVLGTRAAVFAPVADCGLIVVWDDLDDSLAELSAPGWHAREVAIMRASQAGSALVIGGPALSVESAHLMDRDWLGLLGMPRQRVRERMPVIGAAGDPAAGAEQASRMPPEVVALVRRSLAEGPVLLSVPRTGYLPALACQRCREPALCPRCGLALSQPSGRPPAVGGGRDGPAAVGEVAPGGPEPGRASPVPTGAGLVEQVRAPGTVPGGRAGAPRDMVGHCPQHGPMSRWECPRCAGHALRATVVGVSRTVEEIGRAFPGVPIIGSWGEDPVQSLMAGRGRGHGGKPPLVVATPGCEPDPGPLGYSAAAILDASGVLSRPGLRSGEVALARWLALASLVRAGSAGGRVLLVGPPSSREVQALIRWDPLGYAQRELADRVAAGLPPAVRTVTLTGSALATAEMVAEVSTAFAGSQVSAMGRSSVPPRLLASGDPRGSEDPRVPARRDVSRGTARAMPGVAGDAAPAAARVPQALSLSRGAIPRGAADGDLAAGQQGVQQSVGLRISGPIPLPPSRRGSPDRPTWAPTAGRPHGRPRPAQGAVAARVGPGSAGGRGVGADAGLGAGGEPGRHALPAASPAATVTQPTADAPGDRSGVRPAPGHAEGPARSGADRPDASAGDRPAEAVVRWVLSVPISQGAQLASAVAEVQSARSARRAAVVSHRFDPRSLA